MLNSVANVCVETTSVVTDITQHDFRVWIKDSLWILITKFVQACYDYSIGIGIDIGLIGATRDLSIKKLTWTSFLLLTNLVYEISPIPFSLVSAKLWISARTGLPNSGGLIQRGILAL